MNTSNVSTQLDEVYYSVEEPVELSVVPFVFHHPNVERVNLPIASGGYSSKVFDDDFRWGNVHKIEFSSGRSEEQQMGREVEIHPLFIANPFTIVENDAGDRFYLRQQLYISSQNVPPGWRVRSARSLVFILADDPEMRLCAVTFKSYNSDYIRRVYAEYQRKCAHVTKQVFGRSIHSAFVRAVLGIGGLEKVSPKDSTSRNAAAVIAYPSLTVATRENANVMLADKERAQKIAEYLNTTPLKFYPFCLAETTVREVKELPWHSSPIALPPASSEPRMLTAASLTADML